METQPPAPTAARVTEFLMGLSTARRFLLTKAFSSLATFSAVRQVELLRDCASFIGSSIPPNDSELKAFPEGPNAIRSFIASATTLLSFLRGEENTEEILTGIEAALKLPLEIQASIRGLLDLLQSQRSTLDAARDQEDLASSTLPSFDGVEFSVDLRFVFEEGELKRSVPVIIAFLDTDAEGQRLWFQMSKSQLHRLLENVKAAAESVELMESWVKTRGNVAS